MKKNWFNLSATEVAKKLETDIENGLTESEVTKRYETYCKNELK